MQDARQCLCRPDLNEATVHLDPDDEKEETWYVHDDHDDDDHEHVVGQNYDDNQDNIDDQNDDKKKEPAATGTPLRPAQRFCSCKYQFWSELRLFVLMSCPLHFIAKVGKGDI